MLKSHAWTMLTVLLIAACLIVSARPAYRMIKRQYLAMRSAHDWVQWKEGRKPSQEGDPLAWLSAPDAGLSSLVLMGATADNMHKWPSLSRVGFLPEEAGLKLIQAHRDIHFGNLGKLKEGSLIELETVAGKKSYRVSETEILDTERSTRRIMESRREDRLVLMTCYPFRYIGPAPQRYLVWAVEEREDIPGVAAMR